MKLYIWLIAFVIFMLMYGLVNLAGAIERPPIPYDVPFEYDVNCCDSDVMAWTITGPNISSVYHVAAWNEWGLDTELTITGMEGITVTKGDKVKELGGGWSQHFDFIFMAPVVGVHYLNLTATNIIGLSDSRTLLVLAVTDSPPILYPAEPPVLTDAYSKGAQRVWVQAVKNRQRVTLPTKSLRTGRLADGAFFPSTDFGE